MNRLTVVRALWIGAIVLVLVTALIPVPRVDALPSYSDKLVHLLSYLVLGLLAVLSQQRLRTGLLAAAAMIVLGLIVELVQGRLPWRSFEWMDLVANIAGVGGGGLIAWLLTRRKPGA